MAAPRATQFIALRNLARGSHQVRNLHMTGPATYASPILTTERSVLNLPKDIAGLRAECRARKIESAGSKQELISRLNAHELSTSRAFSTAIDRSKRPSAEESSDASKPIRHFNTSRTLKAVKDTSTIDFAYMPAIDFEDAEMTSPMRVPIIPTNFSPPKTGAHAPIAEETVVMKPEISTMSLDAVYLPMSDLTDDHAMHVDFHAMADKVAVNLRRMQVPVEQQAGFMKQLWSDMVDDLVGKKQVTAA